MAKNERPFRIGITGGIGSGKSIVCKIFSILNIPVYDADSRARFFMENDPWIRDMICKNFSDAAYENGQLNRQFLADKVFNNKENLNVLNNIVHPRVGTDFEDWSVEQAGAEYLIKEAALLFESGSYKELDRVILIYCPLEIRMRRIMMRDAHRTRKEIENIIEKQLSDTEKKRLAHYVITNDDANLVIPQVLEIHEDILSVIALA